MTAVLYISTGIALYSAVLSLQKLACAPGERASVHILHAVLALSVAGFACTSAWLPSVAPVYAALLGKAVVAWGLANWLILTWLTTLLFQPQRRAAALGLSVLLAGLSLLNLALPASLVYAEFMPLPYPGIELFARLGQAWLLTHAVIAASWVYALWCVAAARPSVPHPRAGWWVALLLLGGATAIDLLITAGLLSSGYLSPLVWTLLLILVGGGVRDPFALRTAPERDAAAGHASAASEASRANPRAMAWSTRADSNPPALPVDLPGTALHLHWHLDETGQYPPAPIQTRAFHAPLRIGPDVELKVDTGIDHGVVQDIPLSPVANTEPAHEPAAAGEVLPEAEAAPPADRPLDSDLTAIVQFARIAQRRIERGKLDAGKLAALFQAIQKKARHAHDALAEPEESRKITALIARVLAQADAQLRAEGIRVVQRIAEDLPASSMENAVVEQAVRELLHQAIEATRTAARDARKPIVLIARRLRDGGVELSITDGGAEVSLTDIRAAFASLLSGEDVVEHAPLIATAEQIGAQGGRLWCAPNPAGGSIRFLRLPGAEKPTSMDPAP
ncbi:MAG TPA: hypothetical protein VIR60_06945 [Gammaproteobacteria bacterium]